MRRDPLTGSHALTPKKPAWIPQNAQDVEMNSCRLSDLRSGNHSGSRTLEGLPSAPLVARASQRVGGLAPPGGSVLQLQFSHLKGPIPSIIHPRTLESKNNDV